MIKEGLGEKPNMDSFVSITYESKHISGKIIDKTGPASPVSFYLPLTIQGLQEGILLMNKGSTFEFIIPARLAYGIHGAPNQIQGGETVLYSVELKDFRKASEEESKRKKRRKQKK